MPLGMEVGLSPDDFVLDRDPARYPKTGEAPPNFRPTSIVAKRLHVCLWYQKTRVPGLSCGVVCAILRLVVSVQRRLVTDRQTHNYDI